MTTRHNPRGEVAQLYHPDIRDALIQAAARRDSPAIDRVADQLADQQRGRCAQHQRLQQRIRGQSAERYACVGEREDRQHQKRHGLV